MITKYNLYNESLKDKIKGKDINDIINVFDYKINNLSINDMNENGITADKIFNIIKSYSSSN